MKKKGKTIAAAAIVMASLLVPFQVFAATQVHVDGTDYTSANSGTGWSWDGGDNMTLDGYNGGPIAAEGDLNVSLVGDNSITANNDHQIALCVEEGDLKITGEGSLNASTDYPASAIYADKVNQGGNLTIEGTTVNTSGGTIGINASKNLTIQDSTVTAESTYYGIFAAGDMQLQNSTVTAQAESGAGISSFSDIVIDRSNVTAIGSMDHSGLPPYNTGIRTEAKEKDTTVTIKDSKVESKSAGYGIFGFVNLDDNPTYSTSLVVDNSEVTAEGDWFGVYMMGANADIKSLNSTIIQPQGGVPVDVYLPNFETYTGKTGKTISSADHDIVISKEEWTAADYNFDKIAALLAEKGVAKKVVWGPDSGAAKTADETNATLWLVLAALALIGGTGTILSIRKKLQEEK